MLDLLRMWASLIVLWLIFYGVVFLHLQSERIKVKTEQQTTAVKQKRKRAESDDDSDTPLSERY